MIDLLKFTIPKNLLYGRHSMEKITECMEYLGIKRPMLIIDPGVKKTQPAQGIQRAVLEMNGCSFSNLTTNPTIDQVEKAVQVYRKYQPDGVVAIGGGSAIDLAKVCILTAINGGKVKDYLNGSVGRKRFPPFITVPTTCGTGAEASPYAVITDKSALKKRGISDTQFIPNVVILDPTLLESLDPMLIVGTAIDALTHTLESFISRKATNITKISVRGLLYETKSVIDAVVAENSREGMDTLMISAFTSRLLYPRTGLSIAHALSHPLGATTNLHHGMAVFFFLPDSLLFNYPACKKTLSEALSLMGFTSLEHFISWLSELAKKSGIEKEIRKNLTERQIDVSYIAKEAMHSSNIPSNPRKTSTKDLEEVITNSIRRWKLKKGEN